MELVGLYFILLSWWNALGYVIIEIVNIVRTCDTEIDHLIEIIKFDVRYYKLKQNFGIYFKIKF